MVTRSHDGRGVVVFDLDGTLVDTSGDITAAVNHVRGLRSLEPLEVSAVLAEVGYGAAYLIARTTDVSAGDAATELLGEFRRYYRENQGAHSAPYPGIRGMIDALADDYDLYVLSNKPHDAAVREIELHGLVGAFRCIWGAGSLPTLKPDPAGVLEALRQSGVGAERGAMVGDMAVDLATAAAARVSSFLATWGFRPSTVAASGAFVAVGSPSRLAAEVRRAIPARS